MNIIREIQEELENRNRNNNKYSINTGLTIISLIFGFLLNLVIYNWLRNINKCSCSQIKSYNDYLSYISAIFIVWHLILLLSFIIYDGNQDNYHPLIKLVSMAMAILMIIYYIFLLKYIISLKKIKCDCGNLMIENYIYYFIIITFAIVISCIIALLLAVLFSSSTS
jgi:hypothetical protein